MTYRFSTALKPHQQTVSSNGFSCQYCVIENPTLDLQRRSKQENDTLLPPHTIAYQNAYERRFCNTKNKMKTEGDDQKGMPTKIEPRRKIKILK